MHASSWFWSFHAPGCSYGYQGADADPELSRCLMLLWVSSVLLLGGSLACWLGCRRRTHQNPLPVKRDFGWARVGAWAAACLQPTPTCKRDWNATGGHRRDSMVGCPLAAAVLSFRVQPDRWIAPHLAVRTLLDCCRWTSRVTLLVQRIPLWPASWLPPVDKGRSFKSVEVQRFWEVYDERLHFMSQQDALRLDESLNAGDVSRAWLVWSGAAATALADACRCCWGPIPSRGLVLGRGSALFRVVRLGGHEVTKARGNLLVVLMVGVGGN